MGRLSKSNEVQRVERPQMMSPQMGMNPGMMMSPATAREVATVQAQMVVAKCYPRDLNLVMDNIVAICKSKDLANAATYAYARGGSDIKGPSIRLAEALAKVYGNMKYGFEETDSSDDVTTVRTYAFDMETNTLAERTFHVPHVRVSKGNKTDLSDPRDIYETVANQAARRERACILQIIPSEMVSYAMALCEETRRGSIDKGAEARKGLLESFSKFGVTLQDLEAFIQRKFEAIDDSQWLRLRDIYASLRDGIAKKEDFFKGSPAAAPVTAPAPRQTKAEQPPLMGGPEDFDDEDPFAEPDGDRYLSDDEIAF